MVTKLRVHCPAKVNLFLAVGPKDRRGYHPLRTIFQAVGLYDILELEFEDASLPRRLQPFGLIGVDGAGAELPEDNTVTKALRLSREVFAIQPSHVRLEKRIPMQSGLGGGSSDAAGILRALNTIRPVPLEEIEPIASAIGADVPFFLTGGRARGEGYGDRITTMADGEGWFVIVKPPIGCSTPEMYARLDEKPREWRDWPEDDVLYNDFERVAPRECLDVIEQLIRHGARDAALSGSGSSVFGRFHTEQDAASAAERMSGAGQVWVAKSLGRAESLRVETL